MGCRHGGQKCRDAVSARCMQVGEKFFSAFEPLLSVTGRGWVPCTWGMT